MRADPAVECPNADVDRAVTSRDATILVGAVDDVVVASVMAGHDGHRGWIYYLAVSPQLMVREGNETAAAFYTALGYERQDVTVLGKWLTPSPEAE